MHVKSTAVRINFNEKMQIMKKALFNFFLSLTSSYATNPLITNDQEFHN